MQSKKSIALALLLAAMLTLGCDETGLSGGLSGSSGGAATVPSEPPQHEFPAIRYELTDAKDNKIKGSTFAGANKSFSRTGKARGLEPGIIANFPFRFLRREGDADIYEISSESTKQPELGHEPVEVEYRGQEVQALETPKLNLYLTPHQPR